MKVLKSDASDTKKVHSVVSHLAENAAKMNVGVV